MVSAASIALARLNCGHPIWTADLTRSTGYKLSKLSELIMHLSESHCASVNSPQQAIQDKYKSNK